MEIISSLGRPCAYVCRTWKMSSSESRFILNFFHPKKMMKICSLFFFLFFQIQVVWKRFPSERLKSFASICNKSLIGLFVSYNPQLKFVCAQLYLFFKAILHVWELMIKFFFLPRAGGAFGSNWPEPESAGLGPLASDCIHLDGTSASRRCCCPSSGRPINTTLYNTT